MSTTSTRTNSDSAEEEQKDRYGDVGEFVTQWLAPVLAAKLTGEGRGKTWCAQWWRHREAGVRLHALWRGWEAARRSDDDTAMSAWWVYHADAHLRALCDGENGPMWRCTPTEHRQVAAFPTVPVPAGWFPGPPEERDTAGPALLKLGPDPAHSTGQPSVPADTQTNPTSGEADR